jgi:hypothetical protein
VALALVLFAASPRRVHKWSAGLTTFVKTFLAEAAWVASKRVCWGHTRLLAYGTDDPSPNIGLG